MQYSARHDEVVLFEGGAGPLRPRRKSEWAKNSGPNPWTVDTVGAEDVKKLRAKPY
jgi:hypothetical protein